MKIPTDKLKELREQSGAGIMACRNAYVKADQDMEKALEILKEQNLYIAEKKKDRTTSQGIVEAYIHTGGRVGAMVELNCETDFVARTDEFKELAHNLAMQVTAQEPIYVSPDSAPVPPLPTSKKPSASITMISAIVKQSCTSAKSISSGFLPAIL